MNKRIKDFYDQVGLDFENFQRVTVTKGDMEKFAELIVLECAKIADEGCGSACFGLGINGAMLKEHFGVEE
jgi:hypothetical protein